MPLVFVRLSSYLERAQIADSSPSKADGFLWTFTRHLMRIPVEEVYLIPSFCLLNSGFLATQNSFLFLIHDL